MPAMLATPDMRPALMELWHAGFPEDAPADIELSFSYLFRPGMCLVWLEEGKPVSMLFMPEALLELPGAEPWAERPSMRAQYVYAAATLPAYRRQGLFGKLLAASHELARRRGVEVSFLRPAQPSLFGYYKRFGYTPFFQIQTQQWERSAFMKNASTDGAPVFLTGSAAGRRDLLLDSRRVWIRWPDTLVDFAVALVRRSGGELVQIDAGWALCEPDGSSLFIREWLCLPSQEPRLRQAVAARFGAEQISLRRPAENAKNAQAFGMLCPLSSQAAARLVGLESGYPYMGLAMD